MDSQIAKELDELEEASVDKQRKLFKRLVIHFAIASVHALISFWVHVLLAEEEDDVADKEPQHEPRPGKPRSGEHQPGNGDVPASRDEPSAASSGWDAVTVDGPVPVAVPRGPPAHLPER